METGYLRTFREVARWSSFTKAGDVLGYAQSSVTTQIQKLEDEFGVVLFERWGKQIRLTEAGERLLLYTDKILSLLDEAKGTLSEHVDLSGKLSIGTIESLSSYYLPKYLQLFKEANPKVSLSITQGICRDLLHDIKNGEYDFTIVLDRKQTDPDLNIIEIREEPLVLIADPNHRFISFDKVSLSDLTGETMIFTEARCSYRDIVERVLADNDIHIHPSMELESIEAIKRCVSLGLGTAFLPRMAVAEEVATGDLVILPFAHPNITAYIQLAYHKKKWISQSMDKFIKLLL